MPLWEVGLSSWIIQDGNYGNFKTGQRAEFALEFFAEAYSKTEVRIKMAKCLADAKYEIIGKVVYLTSKVWVLDFGICAFQESKPPEGLAVGDHVSATIHLGIDPFFYFEYLYSLPNMPALIYSWSITSIGQLAAPVAETRDPSGLKQLIRDDKNFAYKSIAETDAWRDDGGLAEYVLTCAILDVPPKFQTGP
jgi:hypothetical protein